MFDVNNCGKKMAKACFRMKHAFCLFVVLLFFLLPHSLHADERVLDVALVLDSSGSMKTNDPLQLRAQAAKLFIQLLDRKDRVALMSFSHRAYPVTQLLSLNQQKNERLLFSAIDKLAATGQYTNLHDALLRGYELLSSKSHSSKGRTIVLMSDGKMDLGNQSINLRLLEKTLDELTPKLAAENIKIHTIAFTENSYIPLLKLAAEDTGGEFTLLTNNKGIHQVFERLFERSKMPEMLPVHEDNFVVDKAIDELTVVASKYKPGSIISLESPDGEEYSKKHSPEFIKWFSAEKYDLITIHKPSPGYWLLKYTEGGNKVYLLSNVNLVVTSTKNRAEPNSPLHVEAYLTKNNKIITNRAILDNVTFSVKVTSPEAVEIENTLVDDGTEIGSERHDGKYGISYAFDIEGPYKIEVSAIGQTFDRMRNIFVNVKSTSPQMPFAKMRDEQQPPPIAVSQQTQEKLTETTVDDTKLADSPEIDQETPDQAKELSDENSDTALTHAESSDNEASAESDAADNQHAPTTEHLSAEDSGNNAEHDENESDYKFPIFAFILFNLFLAGLGGAYYFFVHRKKSQDTKQEKQEDSDNKQEPLQTETKTKSNNSENTPASEQGAESNFETNSKALSSLSELDLDEELSSILESVEEDMDR